MNKVLLAGIISISTVSFAQKNMTTNAAMSWKAYKTSMSTGNKEAAQKDLAEAFDYITKSANHETTMNDPKTLMYKGKIYCESAMIMGDSQHEAIKTLGTEKLTNEGLAAFKKSGEADSKGKYEDDIVRYCQRVRSASYNSGVKMYEDKNFAASMSAFEASAMFGDVMGLTDSSAIYYTGIAALKAEDYEKALASFSKSADIGYELSSSSTFLSEAYTKLDKQEEGEQKLSALLKANPGNKDLMISLINLYLGAGKKAEAETVLSDAIALDPENKELHYVVGTIYEGQERYGDAEKAYKKVLELDPNHANALLGLGAVFFNKAANLNSKINDLAIGDPKEDEYRKEMNENFKMALPYLEKAYEIMPENAEIVSSLRQAYYKTGNMEKAKEMKTKLDALKGK